jgi:uncharacterized protein YfaS (alpha-2-macroglobulin family)
MGKIVMQGIKKWLQKWIGVICLCLFMLGIAGCNTATVTSKVEPLPMVAALPDPQIPDWIEQISPTGEAAKLAQIRIKFKDPLIPVERIDSDDQKEILNKFEMIPPLPGTFRFLTPRMVGFQGDKALPKATRVQVTIKAGLKDLNGHTLDQDVPWTFNTETIKLTRLPGEKSYPDQVIPPIDIKPSLEFVSNVELDLKSLEKQTVLLEEGSAEKKQIKLRANLKENDDSQFNNYTSAQDQFDPDEKYYTYVLKPRKTLDKAQKYSLEFLPGLKPINGNLPSETKFISNVSTYQPLAFNKIDYYGKPDSGGAYGRFVQGSAMLEFNNGLKQESALANITLDPKPKKDIKLISAYEGDRYVTLNPWALEPNTNYTITFGENLTDQFEQTLGKPVSIEYKTGDIAADIWSPTGLNIFTADTNLQLNIEAVNLPESSFKAAYKKLDPTDLVYVNSARDDLLPNIDTWESFEVKGEKNKPLETTIPLKEKLGQDTGMLAYGVTAKTYQYKSSNNDQDLWREPQFYGLVQLTNLGIFAQWFPDSGFIKVNHLSDGSAVENAALEIYQSKLEAKNKTTPKACATATTDNTGTAIISGNKWQQCLTGKEAPELLVIARENEDWAFTRTDEYSGAYEYGIYAGWDQGKPLSRGTIFSDRELYQPGEKAWFTGIAYYLQNGELKQDKNASYKVTLSDPNGKTKDLGTQTTNNFGTFSVELPLDTNQPLGYYSITAKSNNGVEVSGDFRVAEFNPPNFKVDLKLDQKFASIGEKVVAEVESNYLFGAPVQSGNVKYYVTRNKTNFIPENWKKYSFGRQWFWSETPPEITSDVGQSNKNLDSIGKASDLISVAKDLPYPMQYRVETQVTDVSNLSVSNVQTFTALPSNRLIGLKTDWVADENKAFPVEIVVTKPDGSLLPGEKVKVELQKIDYSNVTQVTEGSYQDRKQVEYQTISQQNITSGNSPKTINFIAKDSGSYRIRANFTNAKGEIEATDTQIWVTGNEPIYWGNRYQNNRLDIKLDKDSYKQGEIATALIQSPYPDAEVYFAVIRNNTIYETIEKVTGGAPKIQFEVTPDMIPNAAVEAVLIRQGKPLKDVEAGSVENLVKIGFAPFKTNLDDQYLQVEVNSNQQELTPGSNQTVNLQLKDLQDNPTEGQLTVMVVNEAVLQLTGYRPPDLVETVFSEQEISTRLADNRPKVVLSAPASPIRKGWGYGGGLSSSAADTRIRKDFKALAYYNGSVLTDPNGKATVNFTLPDDLTTWRVIAVATDGDFHFGEGENTFITTKPLLSNPILPQFSRLGDRFLGGLSVTNTTDQIGDLNIEGSITDNLQFTDKSQLQTNAELGTKAYRFPIVANKVGESKIQFTTQLNNNYSDAFEVPLEVKELQVTEQVIESGVTQNQAKIPINIDNQVLPDAGGLEISLASTLIPEITAPAKQVFDEQWWPFLETSASQLSIAANLEILGNKYNQIFDNFDIETQANLALDNLEKLQQTDGGFANYPQQNNNESYSDPILSPYAAHTIAQAKAAGLNVDKNLVNNVTKYLNMVLGDPNYNKRCYTNWCKTKVRLESLIALDELGDTRTDFLDSIYQQREQLDQLGQLQLIRYLFKFPQWQIEAKTLFNQFQESVYETGRIAKVNVEENWKNWYWYNSTTATQAEALNLFIANNSKPEVLDRILQGLLALRRDGTWNNSYDNAQALTALVAYSNLETTLPNFSTTIKLSRKALAQTKFQGYQNPNYNLKVHINELPKGKQDLILQKSGKGNLHYLTAYKYRLKGSQPGQLNGLRVTRYIRPANQQETIRKMGLYDLDQPLTVEAGKVFDIGLEIIADRPVDNVIITDYLPAGFEAIDTSFQTSTSYFQAQQDSWQIGYQKLYKDRIVAYGDRLDTGVYSLHYLVRSVTPGNFEYPGAEVYLKYSPEEFGRTTSSKIEIK